MTDEIIYELAVRKAVKNGYRVSGMEDPDLSIHFLLGMPPYSVIFTHNFAKALWGTNTRMEEYYQVGNTGDEEKDWFTVNLPMWHGQLRKMVLQENAVQYLYQFVIDTKNETFN